MTSFSDKAYFFKKVRLSFRRRPLVPPALDQYRCRRPSLLGLCLDLVGDWSGVGSCGWIVGSVGFSPNRRSRSPSRRGPAAGPDEGRGESGSGPPVAGAQQRVPISIYAVVRTIDIDATQPADPPLVIGIYGSEMEAFRSTLQIGAAEHRAGDLTHDERRMRSYLSAFPQRLTFSAWAALVEDADSTCNEMAINDKTVPVGDSLKMPPASPILNEERHNIGEVHSLSPLVNHHAFNSSQSARPCR